MIDITLLMNLVLLVAVVTLAYGSYTDIRKRKVKSLLFVPLFGIAVAQNYFLHLSIWFIVFSLVIYFFTFLETDTYAYLILGLAFVIGSFISLLYGFFWGFQLFVMSIVFLLGFQERLFGIGDIKAIVVLMFATPFYPQLIQYIFPFSFPYPLLPSSLSLLADICIFAVLFVIYAVVMIFRNGIINVPGQPMALKYDESLEKKNPAAFQKHERDGTEYMVYRIPFIVPITLGYVLFITFGFFTSFF